MGRKARKSKKGKDTSSNTVNNIYSLSSTTSHSISNGSGRSQENLPIYSLHWRKLFLKNVPKPRSFHTFCFAPNNFIYCIGGDDGVTFFNDIWAFDTRLEKWECILKNETKLSSSSAHRNVVSGTNDISNKNRVYSSTSGYDSITTSTSSNRSSNYYSSDNSVDQDQLSTSISSKSKYVDIYTGRSGHSCVYYENALWIFGGRAHQTYLNDILRFDLSTKAWDSISTNSAIPRAAHTAIVQNNKMFVFGGVTTSSTESKSLEYLNSFIAFDFKYRIWYTVNCTGDIPRSRAGHDMTLVGNDVIYIWGGREGSSIYNDLVRFHIKTSTWEKIRVSGTSPRARAGLSLTHISNTPYILLYGGVDWKIYFSDMWLFDCIKCEWIQIRQTIDQGESESVLKSRGWHRVVESDGNLYLFGGATVNGPSNDLLISSLEQLTQLGSPSSKESANAPVNSKSHNTAGVKPIANHSDATSSNTKPNTEINISAKISFEGEIRRISLPSSFEAMIENICKEYNFSKPSEFTLHYTDDDDDKIVIKKSSDWMECITFFSNKNIIRIELKRVERGIPINEANFLVSGRPSRNIQRQPKLWQLGNKIGEGAFGKVYVAIDLKTKDFMAVKQVQITTPQMRESTIREITLMKELSHENIVQYLGVEFDSNNQILNIFMELVQGGSLLEVSRHFKCFDEYLVRHYTKQMLEGLRYLHDRKIIHRDIKAANILLTTNGIVKLADFGHSKRLSQEGISLTSGVKGTPLWMAPSVLRGEKQNEFSDIWAIGCVILEMSTGKPPWNEILEKNSNMHHFAIMNIISKQKSHPKYPQNFSDVGKDFLFNCFNMKTTVHGLLNHPFVKEQIPATIRNSESESYIVVSSDEESNLDLIHDKYHGMHSYNGTSDLESDSDDSEISGEEDEDDEEDDDEEEEEADKIVGNLLANVPTDPVLKEQMEAINKMRRSKELEKISNHKEDSLLKVAASTDQVLIALKKRDEDIESRKKTVERLGERTMRVKKRNKQRSAEF